jgi:hypothetical protein
MLDGCVGHLPLTEVPEAQLQVQVPPSLEHAVSWITPLPPASTKSPVSNLSEKKYFLLVRYCLYWAIKMLIFWAAWAEITNQPKNKQMTSHRGDFMYHKFLQTA